MQVGFQVGDPGVVVAVDDVLPAALAMAADMAVNVAPMSAALSKRLLWDTALRPAEPRRGT